MKKDLRIQNYIPWKLLVLYQSKAANDVFLKVRDMAPNDQGVYISSNERVLTTNEFKEIIGTFSKFDVRFQKRIFPENLLFFQKDIIWYEPPGLKKMYFNTQTKHITNKMYWQPGTIYCVNNIGLSVYWYFEDKRPNKDTVLYYSQYFNTSPHVCLGSFNFTINDSNDYIEIMDKYMNAFWNTKFIIEHDTTKKEYWKWRAGTDTKKTPKKWQNSTTQTLGNFLKTF